MQNSWKEGGTKLTGRALSDYDMPQVTVDLKGGEAIDERGMEVKEKDGQEIVHMDRRECEERLRTERQLVFDETEDSPKFASGATDVMDKPDEGLFDLLEEKANGRLIRRENVDGDGLDEISPTAPTVARVICLERMVTIMKAHRRQGDGAFRGKVSEDACNVTKTTK